MGVWNLRTENLDSWYLGQETYVRVVNPEATNKTELPLPDNALFCGALHKLQKYVTLSLVTCIEHFHMVCMTESGHSYLHCIFLFSGHKTFLHLQHRSQVRYQSCSLCWWSFAPWFPLSTKKGFRLRSFIALLQCCLSDPRFVVRFVIWVCLGL